MKKIVWALVFFLLIGQVQFIKAENEPLTKDETFLFLQDAFLAQLSLGDNYRTPEEVSQILSPFFTDHYQQLFNTEHLFSEPEGLIMYGTDVMDYFIPLYSYDENTKVMTTSNKIIVYEYFLPQIEGSVIWDKPHYEVLTITRSNGDWQISDYEISEEKPIKNAP